MDYTTSELMAVAASRELKDNDNVIVGIGLPQVAAILAKYTHAPGIKLMMEHGIFDSIPKDPMVGIADPRAWYGASGFSSTTDVMGCLLHRGKIDIGMVGTLEIDRYGNLNSTQVNLGNDKIRHFTGSGGACDIVVLANKTFIIMRHEKRKFKMAVDYITSPGFLTGGNSRSENGLKGGGPYRVITDLAVMGFDPESREMEVLSIHPGVSRSLIDDSTGFPMRYSAEIKETAEPTEKEISLIREVIDPHQIYTK